MPKVEILRQKGYNFLYIDDYLWMWDIPSEVEIEKDMAAKCRGDVLVAGYGMGVCHEFLGTNMNVSFVTTIEKYKEVVDECLKVFGTIHGKIVIGDFFEYNWDKKFDCIVGDIWEEIHPKFLSDYLRWKEQALKFLKPDGILISWGMDYYEYLAKKEGY